MFAEVDHYRQHHWRCERCGNVVKRAMNRPPQEADCRWGGWEGRVGGLVGWKLAPLDGCLSRQGRVRSTLSN